MRYGSSSVENPNLQQIPKPIEKDDPFDLRRCFIAPAGCQLLIADLSNIELRILAEVSGDATMLRFFAEGKDLHSETARLMFKLAADVDPKKHLVNGKEEATRILKDVMVQACREYLKVVHIPEPDVLEGTYWKKD